jgi:hypothetical protein
MKVTVCCECKRKPRDIPGYISMAAEFGITPEEFVRQNEGTLNTSTGLFCCDGCYIKLGTPTSRKGWKAG